MLCRPVDLISIHWQKSKRKKKNENILHKIKKQVLNKLNLCLPIQVIYEKRSNFPVSIDYSYIMAAMFVHKKAIAALTCYWNELIYLSYPDFSFLFQREKLSQCWVWNSLQRAREVIFVRSASPQWCIPCSHQWHQNVLSTVRQHLSTLRMCFAMALLKLRMDQFCLDYS